MREDGDGSGDEPRPENLVRTSQRYFLAPRLGIRRLGKVQPTPLPCDSLASIPTFRAPVIRPDEKRGWRGSAVYYVAVDVKRRHVRGGHVTWTASKTDSLGS